MVLVPPVSCERKVEPCKFLFVGDVARTMHAWTPTAEATFLKLSETKWLERHWCTCSDFVSEQSRPVFVFFFVRLAVHYLLLYSALRTLIKQTSLRQRQQAQWLCKRVLQFLPHFFAVVYKRSQQQRQLATFCIFERTWTMPPPIFKLFVSNLDAVLHILFEIFLAVLPYFKPWRTRYESVNYGLSNYWST